MTATTVPKKKFGARGPEISVLGYGPMTMSGAYSTGPLSDEDAMKVFEHAFDLGITHIDTAELYGCEFRKEASLILQAWIKLSTYAVILYFGPPLSFLQFR